MIKGFRSVNRVKRSQKRAPYLWIGCPLGSVGCELDSVYIFCYRSSLVLLHIETDSLAISEGFKSRCVDRRVVNKYVPTVVLFDETIALLLTKPFYYTFCQDTDLLFNCYAESSLERPRLRQRIKSVRQKPTCGCCGGH